MASLEQLLLEYETKLMDPVVRPSEKAARIRIFNKSDALVMMKRHMVPTLAIEEFRVRELSPNVVFVTYRVRSHGFGGAPGRVSLRSSVWVERNHKWQVTFHQATLVGATPELL